jgi:hypothetical protein
MAFSFALRGLEPSRISEGDHVPDGSFLPTPAVEAGSARPLQGPRGGVHVLGWNADEDVAYVRMRCATAFYALSPLREDRPLLVVTAGNMGPGRRS